MTPQSPATTLLLGRLAAVLDFYDRNLAAARESEAACESRPNVHASYRPDLAAARLRVVVAQASRDAAVNCYAIAAGAAAESSGESLP